MPATFEYTGPPKNYPAPGTDGVLAIRRWPNSMKVIDGIPWDWAIIHTPTDLAIIALGRKKDAVRIAGELYAKLPADELDNPDAEMVGELIGEVKLWILGERDKAYRELRGR